MKKFVTKTVAPVPSYKKTQPHTPSPYNDGLEMSQFSKPIDLLPANYYRKSNEENGRNWKSVDVSINIRQPFHAHHNPLTLLIISDVHEAKKFQPEKVECSPNSENSKGKIEGQLKKMLWKKNFCRRYHRGPFKFQKWPLLYYLYTNTFKPMQILGPNLPFGPNGQYECEVGQSLCSKSSRHFFNK